MAHVIEAEAPLHAQALVVRGAVAAVHAHDGVVLDVIGELAADAAVRADGVDLLVRDDLVRMLRGREGARRARLHAFAARNTGGFAHRVVEVEDDLGVAAAEGVADDVVHLLLAAGAHAARALDAGIQVHRHRRVREVAHRLLARGEARAGHAQLARPLEQLVRAGLQVLHRHVGHEELDHHLLGMDRALRVRRDFHALRGLAAARRREHALALDLDHARAAVAVGAVPLLVAEVRDVGAVALRGLDDGLAGEGRDRLAVQLELDGFGAQRIVHLHMFRLPK
jgi:hypothetical protein